MRKSENIISVNKGCRICQSRQLSKIFGFGPTPLANAFIPPRQLAQPEPIYPLDVYLCKRCGLVQLRDVISAKILFKDYVYVSSTSPVFIKHFQNLAQRATKRFSLNNNALVIDIGSNDGILLKPFKDRGLRVLGIEPARNVARLATAAGIETIPQFFSLKLAKTIKQHFGLASLVTATNVFAHINDIDEVVAGVKELIGDRGIFIVEAPYLVDFLQKNLFDTVYHEHLSYYAVSPLRIFFAKHGLFIFDAERIATHGGSIRIYIADEKSSHTLKPSVSQLITSEKRLKLRQITTYKKFAAKVDANKSSLLRLMNRLKNAGKRIVGYGAPAKGNTFLNYFNINTRYLEYIVDDSPYKQGLLTPGTHIPVVAPEQFMKDHPDYVFILAWNFAEPIIKRCRRFKERSGRFIIPVPKPRII